MSLGHDIDNLLMRSAKLHEVLLALFLFSDHPLLDRAVACRIMCSVAFEHAESFKMLVACERYTSAFGLLRLQYEVLVRAMWLLYAASDKWIDVLLRDATSAAADKANSLPSLGEMVKAMDDCAPKPAMDLIHEFKDVSWKPLCSFVHGGFHALQRHGCGYPLKLVDQVVKSSNSLSIMAGMLLVILASDPALSGRMTQIQKEFLDCLMPLKEA